MKTHLKIVSWPKAANAWYYQVVFDVNCFWAQLKGRW